MERTREMDAADRPTLTLARQLREGLAEDRLSPPFAKLYSQYTQVRAGQRGLVDWQDAEAASRLNDATRLVEAALIEKEAGLDTWRASIRRAGELLEWLSPPRLNPAQLPLRLLAAAAY